MGLQITHSPEDRLSQKVPDLSPSATGGLLGASLPSEVNKTPSSCLGSPSAPAAYTKHLLCARPRRPELRLYQR